MDKVTDVWGNYYEVHYNEDDFSTITTRGLYVSEIKYTGHESPDGTKQDPFHSVKFEYEPRPDGRTFRFDSATTPMSQRLTAIVTERGRYGLEYEPDNDPTLPSRLGKVTYCSTLDPDECLIPLDLKWKAGDYRWAEANEWTLPTTWVGAGTQFVDLDGDGRIDFVSARKDWPYASWRNNGYGAEGEGHSAWVEMPTWKLPDYLADKDANVLV